MLTAVIVLQGVAIVILLLLLDRTHKALKRLVCDIETVGQMVSIIRDEMRDYYRHKP